MDQNEGVEEPEQSCLSWDLPLPPDSVSQVLPSGGLGSAVNAGSVSCLLLARGPFDFAGLKKELKWCHAFMFVVGCVSSHVNLSTFSGGQKLGCTRYRVLRA